MLRVTLIYAAACLGLLATGVAVGALSEKVPKATARILRGTGLVVLALILVPLGHRSYRQVDDPLLLIVSVVLLLCAWYVLRTPAAR
jgi:hypothetical protein